MNFMHTWNYRDNREHYRDRIISIIAQPYTYAHYKMIMTIFTVYATPLPYNFVPYTYRRILWQIW